MILFSKEKELILKILNGVLLVWFLGAIVFTLNNGINLLVDEPSIEDKIETCKMQCVEEEGKDCGCDSMYYYDDSEHYELKSLYYSIANVIVVGTALYFLNKKKSTKK
ncbi:MAG: hypothetical protein GX032_01750 [Tenericutes bacterium]|nr:hypothetical protein [Bacilli bacterium]NLV90180.1 hypothetical protein [Mycoplasmatota bacterium]